MENKYSKYVCAVPFTSLEVLDKKRTLCCEGWVSKHLPDNSTPKDAWESVQADELRDSILDGSFKYCNSSLCPHLRQIEEIGNKGRVKPIYSKSNIPPFLQDKIDKYKAGESITPTIIQFSFDKSCNLKCPSCRVKIITASKKKILEVQATIDQIQEQFGSTVEMLYITGSGDPFVSVGFRNFLRNFDKTKFPKLKSIHLHTNATMWNKKMWDSMPNIHHLVKTCEISIDAATKDTYENKTRLGGNWEELINNLKFISTIPGLISIKPSFVIQKHNYKEIPLFYKLMKEIFGAKAKVFYGKITNWGTFTAQEYRDHQVWGKEHPEHSEFLKAIRQTLPAEGAWTNAQEFLLPQNKLL